MAIELAAKFFAATDEIFSTESKKSLLTNTDFSWSGAHSIKVYSISTSEMRDYGRTGPKPGVWSRYGEVKDLDATTQEMILRRDRSFTHTIDRLDNDETAQQLAAASSLARQLRQVVVPEIDAYCVNELCSGAGQVPAAKTLSATNVYAEIVKATTALDNGEVPEVGRFLLVTAETYALLKQAEDVVLETSVGQDMRLKGTIANLDGYNIVRIPASRVPVGFGFLAGHPVCACAPVKLADYKIHQSPPGISGDLIEGRVCYDCYVLGNKKNGLYYQSIS